MSRVPSRRTKGKQKTSWSRARGVAPPDLCFPVVPALVQAVCTHIMSGLFGQGTPFLPKQKRIEYGGEGLTILLEGLENQQLRIACVPTAF